MFCRLLAAKLQQILIFKLASLGMRGAQERALLVPDDNIGTYGSCNSSSSQQVQAGVQQHFSLKSMLYTEVQYSTSTDCCTPTNVPVYGM